MNPTHNSLDHGHHQGSASLGVNILKVESLDAENKNVILKLSVEIANYEQFEMITANLKKLSGVFEVTREIGAVES